MEEIARHVDEGRGLLLDQKATAQLFGLSPYTLGDWRRQGFGPRWVRLRGNEIRYDVRDIETFLEEQKSSSIAEERAKGRKYCGAAESGGFR